jgi:transposase
MSTDTATRREVGADSVAGGSIAEEVGVQPRIVSNWRQRFADHGLGGLKDRPRAGKKLIYGAATNKRILVLLEKTSPQSSARWTGPLLAKSLGAVDVQYVWRFLHERTIDLAARTSLVREQRPRICRESRRCGRSLRQSARQGDCSASSPPFGIASSMSFSTISPPTKRTSAGLRNIQTYIFILPRRGRRGFTAVEQLQEHRSFIKASV